MDESKSSKFAQRLKDKLAGSPEFVHADITATELVDSQLDLVSGGTHGSAHLSVEVGETPEGQ